MVELKTQTKKKQQSEKEREDEKDLISTLSDDVLVHIIHLLDTATAVRTSLLSKRWNNLWKSLITLSFRRRDFENQVSYNQFVHHVLSHRDTSIRLHSLDFDACVAAQELRILNLFKPLLHYVPHLRIYLYHKSTKKVHYSIPIIFSSSSLTSLTLTLSNLIIFKLPPSLELPALKTLSLTNVSFTARDDDECAEPFSSCLLLNSLVLMGCSLTNPAKVLSISNSNLSRLTMNRFSEVMKYKIVLSTPNLTHLTIRSWMKIHELSSTCDLALLEEANIETSMRASHAVVLRLLQMLSYAKILILSECILAAILKVVLEDNPGKRHGNSLTRIQVDYAINAFQKGSAYFGTI
ncbi:putative F-box protein At3g44060 [Vigna radiata var. radiata]|uniref:F-box protein At3g44060 n=1 Tax=Vigna radiata var. radiata TaxID=3916 RepID=A0A1S3U8H5_VIGRR|nr:putative F-box protein At3g44060 [Vigna radiata var. radiata]